MKFDFKSKFLKWIFLVIIIFVSIFILKNSNKNKYILSYSDSDRVFVKQQLESISLQELEKFNQEFIKSKEFAEFKPYLSSEFAQQRKLIFEKVNDFVLKFPVDKVFGKNLAAGKDAHNSWSGLFENYCRNFLENFELNKFRVVSIDEFNSKVNTKGILPVYKAVDLEKAAKIKSGEVCFDGGILGAIHAGPSRDSGTGFYVSENFDLAKKAHYCDYDVSVDKKPSEILKFGLDLNRANAISLIELKNLVKAAYYENFLSNFAEQHFVIGALNREGEEVSTGLDMLDCFQRLIDDLNNFKGFEYFKQNFDLRAVALKNELKKINNSLNGNGADFKHDEEIRLNYICDINKVLISSVFCDLGLIARIIGKDVVKIESLCDKKEQLHYCVLNSSVLTMSSI